MRRFLCWELNQQIAGYNVSDTVVMLMGVASAVIDNVPLVAASIGMFSDPVR